MPVVYNMYVKVCYTIQYLPIVFSLQKPGNEPRKKVQYLFKYGKSDTGVMSKLQARKPAHTANLRQTALIHPPCRNKKPQAVWSNKQAEMKLWQKERSKLHPDLTIKYLCRWRKRQKCSSEWPVKQKPVSGKASMTLSKEIQHSLTSGISSNLPKDGGLCCEHQLPWPHRCQWSSTGDKWGKGFSTTPNTSSSREIKATWMKGKQSSKCWTDPWQKPARMTWSQSWSSLKHFPDRAEGYNSWSWQGQILRHQEPSVDDKCKLFILYKETGKWP